MNTLLLSTDTWDLLIDASGDIAMAAEPYSQSQDAASAIRTFKGECYYDTTIGVPYWGQVFGIAAPMSLLKALFNAAALTVPGVATAVTYIASFKNRVVTGQVQITNGQGNTSAARF